MKISRIKIHNYRSIKDVEIDCRSMIVLLGQNNHGKSNILRAVEFALTSSSKPEPDDFYAFRQPEDPTLWVELTFTKLNIEEHRDELNFSETLEDGPMLGQKNVAAGVLPDFEGCCGVSRTQAGKKGKALAALEYFREMEAGTICGEVTSVINHIYGGGN